MNVNDRLGVPVLAGAAGLLSAEKLILNGPGRATAYLFDDVLIPVYFAYQASSSTSWLD